MTSKKTAQQKRAKQPRNSDKTKTFTKDWERLSHSGRFDLRRLKEAMLLLIANEGGLPAEYDDHPLRGEWAGHGNAMSEEISFLPANSGETMR